MKLGASIIASTELGLKRADQESPKKRWVKNMRSCPSVEINEEARCPFANNDNNNDNNFRLQLPGEEALNTIDRSM